MKPMIFVQDDRKRARWISAPFLVIGVVLCAVGLYPMLSALLGNSGALLPGPRLSLFLPGAAAVFLFFPGYGPIRMLLARQRADEWLCLDETGLTLLKGGPRRYWRWSEISDVRYLGRFSLLGRICTNPAPRAVLWLRVPADERRFFVPGPLRLFFVRTVLVIPDDYLTPAKEIAAYIAAFGARAKDASADFPPDLESTPDRAAHGVPAPVVVIADQPPFIAALGVHFAAGIGVAVLIGAVLFVFSNVGQYWSRLQPIPPAHWWPGLVAAGCAITVFAALGVRAFGARSNALLMSNDGLVLISHGQQRRWLWREIIDHRMIRPETELGLPGAPDASHSGPPASGPPDSRSVANVRITVGHHGFHPGRKRHKRPVDFILEDAYQTPIEDIAAEIGLWRDRDVVAAEFLRFATPSYRRFQPLPTHA